jgi:hypothetical protein
LPKTHGFFGKFNITSFGDNGPKNPTSQKNPMSTFEVEDGEYLHSLAFPKIDALDFTYATIFVTRAFRCANLTSMVLE